MKKNQITASGNLPIPGQKHPATLVLTQPKRFHIDIATYMAAIRAAENVDFPQRAKLFDLYEDILMDTHLSSVIHKRKSAILCSIIEFRRNGKPDEAINVQLRSPWFLNFLGDAMDALMQGDTLVQFFRNPKTGWVDYALVPRKHYDPVRRLLLHRQTDITGPSWDEFDDLLFIGQPRALGELAKAAPWVIYKRNTTADWAQFAEIFGMPARKYTFDPDDEEALERLKEEATDQGSNAAYFMPEGCNMELIDSGNKSGSAELYKELVNTCNTELSKLILGNTLTTEAGEKGTQALGTVHNKIEERIAQSDRKFILNVLNYDMTDIFLHMGINTRGGEFCFAEPKLIDPATKISLFTQAKAMGLAVSKKQMYEELGLERPQGEDALEISPSTPLPKKEEEKPSAEEGKQEKEKKAKGTFSWMRNFFGHAPEEENTNHGAPLAF